MTDLEALFLNHLRLCTSDFSAWLQLIHDEIVLEFPYADSAGNPTSVRGKTAVSEAVGFFFRQVPELTFTNPVVFLSSDPHMGFATYQADTIVPATGRRYEQHYIARFREKDGRLAFISEYYDPMRLAAAFQLPRMM